MTAHLPDCCIVAEEGLSYSDCAFHCRVQLYLPICQLVRLLLSFNFLRLILLFDHPPCPPPPSSSPYSPHIINMHLRFCFFVL